MKRKSRVRRRLSEVVRVFDGRIWLENPQGKGCTGLEGRSSHQRQRFEGVPWEDHAAAMESVALCDDGDCTLYAERMSDMMGCAA